MHKIYLYLFTPYCTSTLFYSCFYLHIPLCKPTSQYNKSNRRANRKYKHGATSDSPLTRHPHHAHWRIPHKDVKVPTQCKTPHLRVRVYPFTRVIFLGQNKRKENNNKKVAGETDQEKRNSRGDGGITEFICEVCSFCARAREHQQH